MTYQYFETPPRSVGVGDINGDGVVDRKDLDILISQFGKSGQNLNADLNKDGVVDIYDYNRYLESKQAVP